MTQVTRAARSVVSLVPRSEPVEWLEGIHGKDTYAYGYDVQAGEFGNFVSKEHGAAPK